MTPSAMTQEVAAAKILTAVKGGQTLDAAAAGLTVTTLPPAGRSTGAPGAAARSFWSRCSA